MKKLSLEMLRLTSDEVLGRSQMKKITGGYGNNCSTCYLYANNGQNQPGSVIATLNSAGPCHAGSICYNYPGCFTYSCH